MSETRLPRPRQSEEGVVQTEEVYVIGPSWQDLITIGAAGDPGARLREIQSHSPVPVVLLWTAPGDRGVVRHVHLALGGQRRYGDWFDLADLANPLELVSRLVDEADQARQISAMAGSTEALASYRQTLLAEVAQTEQRMRPAVVSLVRSGRVSLRAAARAFGLSRQTVKAWTMAAAQEESMRLTGERLTVLKGLSTR